MGQILHPRTLREMSTNRDERDTAYSAPSSGVLEAARDMVNRQIEADRAAAAATKVTPDQIKNRYVLMPGKVLIAKTRAQQFSNPNDPTSLIITDSVGVETANIWEPWGTILMVGDGYHTDYGTRVDPHPEWRQGARVMFNPLGGQDVELEAGGVKLTLTMVPFRNVVMVDLGEEAAEEVRIAGEDNRAAYVAEFSSQDAGGPL